MKKIISMSIAIFLLQASTNLLAQAEPATNPKARFGFKVSPAFSWIKPDFGNVPTPLVIENPGWRTGFSYGVHLEFLILENLYIQTGIDMQSHSASIKQSIADISTTNRYKMNYVEIPALFKARTNEIGYLRYFGQFGFAFSGRTRVRLQETITTPGIELTTDVNNANDRMNFFRVGMVFGAGTEYSLSGNTALILGITYNDGISNILRKQSKTTFDERGMSKFLQFNVGILF
jgi:hypothetical protein